MKTLKYLVLIYVVAVYVNVGYAETTEWVQVRMSFDIKNNIRIHTYLYTPHRDKPVRHVKTVLLTPNNKATRLGQRIVKIVSLQEADCAHSYARNLWLDYYNAKGQLIQRHSYQNPFFPMNPDFYSSEYADACVGYHYQAPLGHK
ncbi:MAG: hypothetical protein K0Q50_2306 [Vampirovibrio sp.]|jgi:hypothetical protein|nr:hypothetical protein [Vampirovibrio sp.]MDF3055661.1 hypothetical protein [Gammaproteobacteria bacterium]